MNWKQWLRNSWKRSLGKTASSEGVVRTRAAATSSANQTLLVTRKPMEYDFSGKFRRAPYGGRKDGTPEVSRPDAEASGFLVDNSGSAG